MIPHVSMPKSATSRLVVIDQPVDRLRPDPNNPRVHSHKQIGQVAKSIEAFGFNVPVLVDSSLIIVAGHGRVLAARKLGLTSVPTIRLDHLSDAQRRAFLIADNRLTENASWDERLLAEQFVALSALDLDFSLEITGFDIGEIDRYIDRLDAPAKPASDPDDLPVPVGPAVTRSGDMWLLERHRVLCGDARASEAYAQLMGEVKSAAVFVDPPYNVRIANNVSGLGRVKHADFAMGCGEMDISAFTSFLGTTLGLHAKCCSDGALVYVCMDWRHMTEVLAAAAAIEATLLNLCVWAKDNGGMGAFYRSQHELVFVFKVGTGGHRNNVQLGKHGRNRSNVWRYPSANSFARNGSEDDLLTEHPTVKPVGLVADALRDCTAPGEIVLDGFLGSGTTLIAAERTKRICHGLELDPRYVDLVVRRWQRLTGKQAIHAVTNVAFDESAHRAEGEHDA